MKPVELRPMVVEDVKEMLLWPRYEAEEEVWANIPVDEVDRWLSTYHQPPWCYCLAVVNSNGMLVGRINLAFLNDRARVGGIFNFTIRRDLAGQGYGQGALSALLKFGFERLALSAIYLNTPASNHKARHIYEKFGFEAMGFHYDYRDDQGYVKFIDLVAWSEGNRAQKR